MTEIKNKPTSVYLDQEHGERGTEEREKFESLKVAIQEGMDSGIVHDFDFDKNLVALNAKRRSQIGKYG